MKKQLIYAALAAACALPAAILPVDDAKALFNVPPAGKPEAYTAQTDVPSGSAIAFDRRNRPYIVNAVDPASYGYVSTIENGKWVKRDFTAALKAIGIDVLKPDLRTVQTRAMASFDADDNLYILIAVPRQVKDGVDLNGNLVLLYSGDHGKTFKAYPTESRPYLGAIESSSSGRIPAGPPALFRGVHREKLGGEGVTYSDVGVQKLDFCALNRFDVILPEKTADGLKLPKALVLTDRANGIASHSGANNIAARADGKLFIAYIEVPADPATGGNPTFVAEVDLAKREITGRQLVANATPLVSDGHSCPTMVLSSKGELDLVTGSHGWGPKHPGFLFLRSLKPLDLTCWSEPERLGAGQSYVDAVIDSHDNIYIAYRVHPQLRIQKYDRKAGKWLPPVSLLEYTPSRQSNGTLTYTVFYHHLFIDRKDNLYVKALFHDFNTGLKGKFPLMWLVSSDGGKNWRIPDTAWINANLAE
ncbi:MAG: hypothetical protein AB7F32_00650 [Victivallaceae bacterium]